jgi:dCTP deaminase
MTERSLGDWYDPKDLREYQDPRPEWLKDRWGRLSDRDILRCLEEGIIKIEPLSQELPQGLNTCKIDFHLGELMIYFLRSRLTKIDLIEDIPPQFQEEWSLSEENPYMLHPGETVLASTYEWLTLPTYIAARIEGKSRLARRGLGIQLAALIDAGWDGRPTLELHNNGVVPIELKPYVPIGAFSFELLTSPALFPYGEQHRSRYKEQDKPRY